MKSSFFVRKPFLSPCYPEKASYFSKYCISK